LENNPDVKVEVDKPIKRVNVVVKNVNEAVNKTNSRKPVNTTKQITIPKEFNFSKRLEKEPKKTKFLENNPDVKVEVGKPIKSSVNVVVKNVNEAVNKTNSRK